MKTLDYERAGKGWGAIRWATVGAILAIAAVVVGTDTPTTPEHVVPWLALGCAICLAPRHPA